MLSSGVLRRIRDGPTWAINCDALRWHTTDAEKAHALSHGHACVHIHPLAHECSMCTHPPSGSRAQHVCDTSTLWLTGAACVRIHPLAHERILCKQHGTLAPDMQCTFPNTRARTCVHALDSPSCRRVRKQNKNFVRCSSARSSSLGLIFLHQSTLHSRLEWW
jgi:hypothetical protein